MRRLKDFLSLKPSYSTWSEVEPDLEVSEKWSLNKILQQRIQCCLIKTVYSLIITTAILNYACIFTRILHPNQKEKKKKTAN